MLPLLVLIIKGPISLPKPFWMNEAYGMSRHRWMGVGRGEGRGADTKDLHLEG